MKKQNYQLPENRIYEAMQVHRNIENGYLENPETTKTKDMHHINLPHDKSFEIWYDDSIGPIGLNEYQEKALNHTNRRHNSYHGNTFEPKPFNEMYNMVVMRDCY